MLTSIIDWLGGRYYIVEYDPADVEDAGMPVNAYGYKLPCTINVLPFGGSGVGVFRSYRLACRYLKYMSTVTWVAVTPDRVTRIKKDDPLVAQSLWR